ncbi:MAG: hypothetical protein JWR77_2453 [Rhizorhabdus sp.]|nr:hypothetical protein [Rhizorhabdus sp.]
MKNTMAALALLALPLVMTPAFGQVVTLPQVKNAAGQNVPAVAAVLTNPDGSPFSSSNPLPTSPPSAAAATSTPLTGTSAITQTVGPFTPQLGRPIWLTLSGTWSGAVSVQRSTDGGTTKLPLTIGGSAWAVYTANANEAFGEESSAAATYWLAITISSGTLTYEVRQ